MDLNRQYLTERIRELLHHLNVDVVVDLTMMSWSMSLAVMIRLSLCDQSVHLPLCDQSVHLSIFDQSVHLSLCDQSVHLLIFDKTFYLCICDQTIHLSPLCLRRPSRLTVVTYHSIQFTRWISRCTSIAHLAGGFVTQQTRMENSNIINE